LGTVKVSILGVAVAVGEEIVGVGVRVGGTLVGVGVEIMLTELITS